MDAEHTGLWTRDGDTRIDIDHDVSRKSRWQTPGTLCAESGASVPDRGRVWADCRGEFDRCCKSPARHGWGIEDITGGPQSYLSNPAEIAEERLLATVLAEPFPRSVVQGDILVIAKEFSGSGSIGVGMSTGIGVLDERASLRFSWRSESIRPNMRSRYQPTTASGRPWGQSPSKSRSWVW